MSTGAKAAIGTTINRAGTPVVEVKSISCPQTKADAINCTNMDSTAGWAEFIAGIKDGGDVTLGGNWKKDASQTVLQTDLGAVAQAWTIVLANSGGTISFSAFVIAFSIDAKFDGAQEFSCTLKVTGAVSIA